MKKALISVSDKTGVLDFARRLSELGFEIISTGGTHKALADAGLAVTGISDVTGFPECLDGRVKTLHPKIHAGILAIRDNPDHMRQIAELGVDAIDIVAVNLYPFKETISKPDCPLHEAIENIDIGGPTMLRAAAKNYPGVSVVTDPADYPKIIGELTESGKVSEATNFYLAAKVFMHTAYYDSLISAYLRDKADIPEYPDTITFAYEKVQGMRYGENPHQSAAFYKEAFSPGGMLADVKQLHGKELSFNNINDTHGALELLKEFDEPTVVACKHSNPCGVASADTVYEAYMKAYNSDNVSIFGGIVVVNREIDKETAEEISRIFVEIILAPSFSPEALEILTQKKNIRVLELKNIETKQPKAALDFKKVSGGLLVQSVDSTLIDEGELQYVTKRRPTAQEMEDLLFAFKIVKYVKSNGIAIGKNKQSLGIGPGQVNRIWACKQSIEHCKEFLGEEALRGAALASDAFFPFPDCVLEAANAGVTAIIQPGGSVNDKDSIELCDRHGIAMVFTGVRHFRH